MTKLTDVNINTVEHYQKVWALENVHRYDAVRMRAFLQDMRTECIDVTTHSTKEQWLIPPAKRFLDVGAGWWGAAQYAVQHGYFGQFTALDFSEEARRRTLEITPTLEYRIGDARAMPFADGDFDVVACGELIEHMEDVPSFVAELVRVCKPGGKVIIGTLNDKCDAAIAHGEYPEHIWSFTPDDLVGFLAQFGSTTYWEVGHYHFVQCIVRQKGAAR